jgi:hypothetical protein
MRRSPAPIKKFELAAAFDKDINEFFSMIKQQEMHKHGRILVIGIAILIPINGSFELSGCRKYFVA